MAVKGNIVIEQNSNFNAQIELDSINGTPFELINHDVKAQMKKSHQASATVDFTTSIVDVSNGIVEIAMTPDTTGGITAGRYVYDVIVIDNIANTVNRVVEGIATVTPGVTTR